MANICSKSSVVCDFLLVLLVGEKGFFLSLFLSNFPSPAMPLMPLFILGACLKTSLEGQRVLFLRLCMEDVWAFCAAKMAFSPTAPRLFS